MDGAGLGARFDGRWAGVDIPVRALPLTGSSMLCSLVVWPGPSLRLFVCAAKQSKRSAKKLATRTTRGKYE
eukprot:scaffold25259_cov142-Isochrysis_galbana.AAC.4